MARAVSRRCGLQCAAAQSEACAFGKFRAACRSGDEKAMINAFWRWVNHLSGPGELATLEQLSRRAGDAQFVDFKNKMSVARYGDPPAAWLDKGQILPQAGTLQAKAERVPQDPR